MNIPLLLSEVYNYLPLDQKRLDKEFLLVLHLRTIFILRYQIPELITIYMLILKFDQFYYILLDEWQTV